MKDEIKEFIEFRTDEDGTYFYYNDKDNIEQWSYKLDELKDYITNLQQKYEGAIFIGKELNKDNERLKQYIDFYEDLTKQQINMINDYKSRNKKAFEYIKNNCYYLVDNDDKNLLNILQGGDK